MSKSTSIQWSDSTTNPTMGCDGCELWSNSRQSCYAGVLHRRFGGSNGYAPTFDQVTLFPGRMAAAARWSDLAGTRRSGKPWLDRRRRAIFVSDMSDALSARVTFEYLRREIISNVTSEPGRRHDWLWLTKRPQRMARFCSWLQKHGIDWPSNLWAGTSVTTATTTGRIEALRDVGNELTQRFVSVEPQLEPIDFTPWLAHIDWLIQGGESGHNARAFDTAWASDLIRECRRFRVALFLKQLGAQVMHHGRRLAFNDAHAGNWSEWPKALRVREMPMTKAH